MPTIHERLRAPVVLAGLVAVLVFCAAWLDQPPEPPPAQPEAPLFPAERDGEDGSDGHRVYLPVHTEVVRSGTRIPAALQITVVVRNTDEDRPIRVVSARSYDASGRAIEQHIRGAVEVPPMAVHALDVPARGPEEASVASFVVEWTAEGQVLEPMVEAIMVSSHSARGLSLRSVGRSLEQPTGSEPAEARATRGDGPPPFVPERTSARLDPR